MTTTSLPSKLTDGQSIELVARAGRAGLTVADTKRLLGDDALMRDWVNYLHTLIETGLVHGRYTATDKILERMTRLLSAEGRNFNDFVWIGDKQTPTFGDNRKELVALKATLGTYAETMHFLWGLNTSAKPSFPWRESAGHGVFRPYTLEWVKLQWLQNPRELSAQDALLPVETLCAMFQHPVWLQQKATGIWLIEQAGAEIKLPHTVEVRGGNIVPRDLGDALVPSGLRFIRV